MLGGAATPETPVIGEDWSKLVATDQFQPVSHKKTGISFRPVLTETGNQFQESGVLFLSINRTYAQTEIYMRLPCGFLDAL